MRHADLVLLIGAATYVVLNVYLFGTFDGTTERNSRALPSGVELNVPGDSNLDGNYHVPGNVLQSVRNVLKNESIIFDPRGRVAVFFGAHRHSINDIIIFRAI